MPHVNHLFGPFLPVVPAGASPSLYTSIRNALIATPAVFNLFGEGIHPGQAPPGTAMPYIVLSLVSARNEYIPASDLQGAITWLNAWNIVFQVAVYSVGYESTRLYAQLVHRNIDRHLFGVDCYFVFPYVNVRTETLDPKRSEDGREVWNFAYRYDCKVPEFNLL